METARGRWFLAEFARRNRQSDTKLVLEAVEKLQHSLEHKVHSAEADRLRFDLSDMMNAITRTKAEIASIKQTDDNDGKIDVASHELDAIVGTTEKATSDILACAERIQEIAWTMREQGLDASVCDMIDANTTEIYTACSFQDLTGQRIRKVIQVLSFLEARIDAMIQIWRLDDLEFVSVSEKSEEESLLNGPARPGEGLEQNAIDNLMGEPKRDVDWEDATKQDHLAGLDLDDLVVLESLDDTPSAPAIPVAAPKVERPKAEAVKPPAPKASAPAPKPEASAGDDIRSLSPASKMALFS